MVSQIASHGIASLQPAHIVTPTDNNWTKTALVWSSIGYESARIAYPSPYLL